MVPLPLHTAAEAAGVAGLAGTVGALESQVAAYRETLDRTIGALRDHTRRQQEIIDALSLEVQQHRDQAGDADATIAALEHAIEEAHRERAAAQREAALLNDQLSVLRTETDHLKRLSRDFTQVQRDLEFTREAMRVAQHEVWLMRLSSSWRYTAPLRAFLQRFGATTTEKLLQTSK